ncbi:hypothetical protein CCAX7_49450 [Capsulimonas corticalis]|uniref:Uncharacterized protein n=1 Tax=Capsulimonas corticalis TaxID=2219043 RepID=A0A402CPZ5_9BACT|nr:hypothetical protein [Capsulimonas corticalis]BDI32894.1 hypothetical protein CCAX7_49450 [Capsulimonas corticalis]
MPSATLIDQLVDIAARRLGGNLKLLALYGSAADNPQAAHDLDFLLVVDAVENCVTYATRDCRTLFPNVQFFVMNTREYELLPAFYRFQFAFAKPLRGDLALPAATRRDAEEAIRHGYTDTLRTMRQQFKRRDWIAGDDWARQVWWNLKSFKYATLDVCWLLRKERPRDIGRAALILEAEGLASAAKAINEWPELDIAAQQLLHNPIAWLMRWEPLITAAYAEVMPLLSAK